MFFMFFICKLMFLSSMAKCQRGLQRMVNEMYTSSHNPPHTKLVHPPTTQGSLHVDGMGREWSGGEERGASLPPRGRQ